MITFISIINAQIFAYKKTKCPDGGANHYSTVVDVRRELLMFMLNISEDSVLIRFKFFLSSFLGF